MSQKYLRIFKFHKESHIEDILNGLLYEKSVFIQSDLCNDQFVFLIQNLYKLSHLTEFGIETCYKSLQDSSSLSLLSKDIKILSQLTKLALKFERQIEDVDSNKIFIELGESLKNLNNLEDLALSFGNMNLFSEVGAANLASGISSLKFLNKFHISIYVYNQQEEQLAKQILSSLRKQLTELSINITKYEAKGKKEKADLNPPNILNLQEFTQLKDLKLTIDKKIKNYEFNLNGFVKSLEYLKNLNKIYLKIDQMSFKQVNFSEFYDRLFQIDSLEELETHLVVFQIDKNVTLGENMSEKSQLKYLNLVIVNKEKKCILKFGKNISKFNQFRQLSLDFTQIELSDSGNQDFFKNLQKLEKFSVKLDQEGLSPSIVENFQFLQQLKVIQFVINNSQKQIEGNILPFFKSIKNLVNLDSIEIRYCLLPLIVNEEDVEQCFQNLINLKNVTIILQSSQYIMRNFELVAPLFKGLTYVENLQAQLEILENPAILRLISQNLGQLTCLKILNLKITSYMCYNEYQLRQEDIQNLCDGISKLVNLISLNIYFDTSFDNYNFLFDSLSSAVQNLTRLRYLQANLSQKLINMNRIFKLKNLVVFDYFTYW
ncbi:hypothetical protein ABPG74_010126 [Tetrahymena malaccensis]